MTDEGWGGWRMDQAKAAALLKARSYEAARQLEKWQPFCTVQRTALRAAAWKSEWEREVTRTAERDTG